MGNRKTSLYRERTSGPLAWFFREGLRRIWVSKKTSFVAIGMISVALVILGGFLLVADNLALSVDRWQARSRMTVYFEPEASGTQIAAVESWLAAQPGFGHRQFVPPEQALTRFKALFENLTAVVDELEENPFPPSIEIEVERRNAESSGFDTKIETLRAMPGVDVVQFDWEWASRLRTIAAYIRTAGFFAGGLLAVAAIFMIANVIRLATFLYQDEIQIMRLVGATEAVVRGPFLVEGLLQGTIGGLLSVGLLFLIFQSATYLADPSKNLLASFLLIRFLSAGKCVAIVFAGTLAGLLGSWISVMHRTEESAV